ncbi:hypothetical protein HO173_003216 [Letharia columbiana]|uniref:Uncharacterized protein n=1 Tax=Letharia columbiana TaxID=112416 RepID=A0A8H6L7S7_9LECA|nr:uncharacterized protein HO173_003216 [Letharia columbiana]KAF6238710.1 hypothetical protein HO173_003216 [Letharia columbiana]
MAKFTRFCEDLPGFDHHTLRPGKGCVGCGVEGREQQPKAPISIIDIHDSPRPARMLGKRETPASLSRTSSITRDQALNDTRSHAGSRAMHTGGISDRARSNDSGVTASISKALVTPRHQFYDPASLDLLELEYTNNKSFRSISLRLVDKNLPGLDIEQWIKEDMVPEGETWNAIIYDPRVTRRRQSVLNSDFTRDILQACKEEKGERTLFIVCEIPDPDYLQAVESPIKEDKATRKKAAKKEPESKKDKTKKESKPTPAEFKAPLRPSTRATKKDPGEDLQGDVVETGSLKLEGIKEEGLEVKEEGSGETESDEEEDDEVDPSKSHKRGASVTSPEGKNATKRGGRVAPR